MPETWLRTADGVRLAALHLPGASRGLAVVVAHGFTWSSSRPGAGAVHRALARHAGVVAFDFRGHGGSGGMSTVGDLEVDDLAAAVRYARDLGYRQVATLGFSMGGAVVLRHAGLHGGVDAVISVSAPAHWFYRGTRPMRRVHFVIERPVGRLLARHLLGTRVAADGWRPAPLEPVDLVGRIPPTPLLLVHGDRDAYLPVGHARSLAEAAGSGAQLWVVPGFGHAEGAADAPVLDRIAAWLRDAVAPVVA